MQNLPSLSVIYDISLKQFDFIDRAFDSLTSRAAAMIGWTSFITTAAIFVQSKMDEAMWLRLLFSVCVFALAGLALVSSLRAYFRRDVEPWPSSLWFVENYAHETENDTLLQLMGNIETAIKKNTRLVYEKGRQVDLAVKSLAGLTAALLLTLSLSFLL